MTLDEELGQFIRRYWDAWPICMMAGCQVPAVVTRGKFYIEPYCFRCNQGLPGEWAWLTEEELKVRW